MVVVLGVSVAAMALNAQGGGPPRPVGPPAAPVTPDLRAAALTAQQDATGVPPSIASLPIRPRSSVAALGSDRDAAATVTAPAGSQHFQTLGVTWRRGSAGGAVTVRVRTHSGTGWSGWHTLDTDEDTLADAAAPPAGTPRDGTGSLYTGPADGAEARVTAGTLPRDLRFELVDAGTAPADATARPVVTTQTAGPARPTVMSRAAWGADESLVTVAPTYMSTVRAAVLHHTAGPNGYSRAAVPSIIRGDYAFHVKSRGWSDIGYNALIDRFGRIWEGRRGGLDRDVMGAHAGGFNTDTFGVAAIGSYQYAHPSPALLDSAGRLFAWKLALNHRSPQGTARLTSQGGGTARYRAGTTVTLPAIIGHRDTGYTECPGGHLYARLGDVRATAMRVTDAGLIDPRLSERSVVQGTPVTITSTALRDQTWRLTVTGPCGAGDVATRTGRAAAGSAVRATWDGQAGGAAAPAGRYTLTLTSASSRGPARPVTRSVLVVPPAPAPETPGTPSAGTGGYVPLPPARLLDTRRTGVAAGPNGRVTVDVRGHGGVPANGVTAVVLNLVVRCASDDTELSVWPTGGPRNSLGVTGAAAGRTRSVLVTSRVGAGGEVTVGNLTGVSQLTADVVGYYAAGGGAPLRAIPSTRVYDSSTDPAGPLGSGQTRTVTLPATIGGVPSASVRALLVDVGGSAARSATLTAHATGTTASPRGMTFSGGAVADSLAIVPVTAGAFALTATGGPVAAQLDAQGVVVDAAAGGSALTATAPRRVLDAPVAAGRTRRVTATGGAVPGSATAVLLQVSALDAAADAAAVQVSAGASPVPAGAALRVPAGATRGNLALVPLGAGGTVQVTPTAAARVRLDVLGYLN